MNKRLSLFLPVLGAALLLASCSETSTEDYSVHEQAALNAWVKENHPEAGEFGDQIFVQWFRTPAINAPAVELGDWVMLDYNGRSLQNNIFATRNAEVAKLEGTYKIRTHYVPEYTTVDDPNYYILDGLHKVLLDMKQGDSAIVYMPSAVAFGAYGSSFSGGYQGQFSLSGNVPCIYNIKVTEVVSDPSVRENDMVKEYATERWGMAASDYIEENFYLSFVDDESKDAITEDSTTKIWYVGRFLDDDFVFDTNIDSIAKRLWDDETTHTVLTYKPVSKEMIDAFYQAATRMRYDTWGKMVFSSTYGYGANGSSSGSTVIPAYTPLVFEFYIETNIEEDEEND